MIDVAIEATRAAGELAFRYFKTQPKVSYKPDGSPVTAADIEAEKLIRKIITKNFPDHGIIGEELPPVNPNTRFQWVIDPIDGTRYFILGYVFWGTLLALLKDDKPLIGIAFLPALNEFLLAQKNKGTYLNDQKVKVSKINKLSSSTIVSSGGTHYFAKINKLDALIKLHQESLCRIGIGGVYGYARVASGRADICLDATSKIHDIAAPSLLITEAGGKFTDLKGRFTLSPGSFLATNGFLHDQVLKILNSKTTDI